MSIDLLNVDVSNDGDTYMKVLLEWYPLPFTLGIRFIRRRELRKREVDWMN